MIESIELTGIATYTNAIQEMIGLSKVNYIFGANSTGKTTITRVIADEQKYPSCKVTWKDMTKLQPLVYNRDFVEKNFSPSTKLKGIFTLGEKNVANEAKIATARAEIDTLQKTITQLNSTLHGDDGLSGKTLDLRNRNDDFKSTCWAQKTKHEGKLKEAFRGFLKSAEQFKDKILIEANTNTSSVETLSELEKRAVLAYGPEPSLLPIIPVVTATALLGHETNPVLLKAVVGKDDVDIAAMIKSLGNSDWVRKGRTYFDDNQSICPFCQQPTPNTFAASLAEYFDESFTNDSKAIEDLVAAYSSDSEQLIQQIRKIIANPSDLLDLNAIESQCSLIESRLEVNTQKLATKQNEPSKKIQLEPVGDLLSGLTNLIDSTNKAIAEHNDTVSNLAQKRKALTAQVWKYLVAVELKQAIASFAEESGNLNKAIEKISAAITAAEFARAKKAEEIKSLEKSMTSVQPTVDGINRLLATVGFKAFTLAKVPNANQYVIVRPDNSNAQETLSEGERSFVTFLYFYHLLKGSDSETGLTLDRIVVFDDPVSSLDGDVLFVVSSLIRRLIAGAAGYEHVKQLFVLTHNVYFHKEITFEQPTKKKVPVTYWVVQKSGLSSVIKKHAKNPIQTSYELLWQEVRGPDRNNFTIQNTLRRILEHYFTHLGDVQYRDKATSYFDGEELIMCESLFSWINEGSHHIDDGLHYALTDEIVDKYLIIFKAIFVRYGQENHYNMMMKTGSGEAVMTAGG